MLALEERLGIEIPVLTTGICSSKDVIDAVGDDANGWFFTGVSTQQESPELEILKEIVAPVQGVEPSEVDAPAAAVRRLWHEVFGTE